MKRAARGQVMPFFSIVMITIIVLFPIYWAIVTSLVPTHIVLSRNPPLVPPLSAMSFQAYVDVFTREAIFHWLLNSALVTSGAIVISLAISVLAGYSLSRFNTVAQLAAGYTMLLTKMLPVSLIVIPFFVMFTTFHMINNPIALMLANSSVGVPFATWMLKSFFDSIPRELEQAAMVDGCTPLGALWYVILPLARPGISAAAIYLAIISWSDLIFARTLTQDPDRWTMPVGIQNFIGEYEVEWASLMAAGMISLIPIIILFILLEPFLVSGLTQGSVR
ncbi:MAG: carbohydrate ABC transporter permease [Pseudomonadota bacterium]